jgi:hypothetical protein
LEIVVDEHESREISKVSRRRRRRRALKTTRNEHGSG